MAECFRDAQNIPDANFRDLIINRRGLGARDTGGLILQAYVLKVYDLDVNEEYPPNKAYVGAVPAIYCDIQVISPNFSGPTLKVPVMSQVHGYAEGEFWRPRPVSIDFQNQIAANMEISQNGSGKPPPSILSKCDGDCVLVSFINNDSFSPVIIGQLPNPNSKIVPGEDTTKIAYKKISRGNEVSIEDGGNVTVDIRNQTTGDVDQTSGPTFGDYTKAADQIMKVLFSLDEGSSTNSTITLNNSGIETLLRSSNSFKVSGGGSDTIHLGEASSTSGLQKIMTEASLKNITALLQEWAPIIMAAAGMFGIPTTQTASIVAALAQGSQGAVDSTKELLTQSLRGE